MRWEEPMAEMLAAVRESKEPVVAVSMIDENFFDKERFLTYMALNVMVAEGKADTGLKVLAVLDEAKAASKERVYLQLDPTIALASKECDFIAEFCQAADAMPTCSIQILLPNPALSYWTGRSEEQMQEELAAYEDFLTQVSSHANVTCYYLGAEEWLYRNPGHFTDTAFKTNEVISQKLFLFTFCDGLYQTNPADFHAKRLQLTEAAQAERANPTEYPDFSGKTFVFFGDSIIDYVHGSHSIPGFLEGLTGAHCESSAHSGSSATQRFDYPFSFPEVAAEFLASKSPADYSGTELYFFIHFGLNDYFTGLPVDSETPDDFSYAGSLRNNIAKLKASFPESVFILSGPTFTPLYEGGTMVNSEAGDVLTAYRDAAKTVADETGCLFLDNYKTWELTEETAAELLTDGVHPGEQGRYLFTLHLMDFLTK